MTDTPNSAIGFIGLGNMGLPMARNLQRAGFTPVAFDIAPERIAALEETGPVVRARTLAEVVASSRIVFTILPSEAIVRQSYLGEGGLLASASPGSLLVDLSTVSADTAREISRHAASLKLQMMDAPVSGGVAGATAGELTFMVGNDGSVAERLEAPLRAMGRKIVYCGGPGKGQVVKICNNLLVGISMIATAEALALGVRQGVAPELLTEVIAASTGSNWCVTVQNPYPGVIPQAPSSHGYAGGAAHEILLKDVGLAVDAAAKLHMPMFLGGLSKQIYELAIAQGLAGLDFSSVVRLYDDPAPTAVSGV